jgi:serine/threonine protein kinase
MWPSAIDFSEAVQNPKYCFPDEVLKSSIISLDRFGMPFVASGQFAAVFKAKVANEYRAIRCFTRELGDREKRYKEIDAHLDSCGGLPVSKSLAGFEYDPAGIMIRGRLYPVMIMEWVEGNTLDCYLGQITNRKDSVLYLAKEWSKLIRDLRAAKIAHGDLQHGNIIVQPNMQLKLVDFDGMFVPRMSGLKASELGHRDYQHPARNYEFFNTELDNFSSILIYVTILLIAHQPELWNQFHDEGLIIKQQDFLDPKNSRLFRSVNSKDAELLKLLGILKECCSKSLGSLPALPDLVSTIEASRLPFWMRPQAEPDIVTKTREVKPADIKSYGQEARTTFENHPTSTTVSAAPTQPQVQQHPRIASKISYGRFIHGFFVSFFAGAFIYFFPWIWVNSFSSARLWHLLCAGVYAMLMIITGVRGAISASKTQASPPTPSPLPQRLPPIPVQPRPWQPSPGPQVRTVNIRPYAQPTYYVGSTIRFIYHKPLCEWAQKISARTRIKFSSASEARSRGYRPCRVCCP